MEKGANVEAQDSKGYTPLFYASKAAGIEGTYHLLEGKADPSARGINKKTPLFKATTYKDVLLLNEYGTNKYAKRDDGMTALEYLTENEYKESPLALLDCDIFQDGKLSRSQTKLKSLDSLQVARD